MAADYRILSFNFLPTLTLLLSVFSLCDAFYIPGWSIRTFKDGESIPLLTNKISSDKSPLQYSYANLPFVGAPSGRRHGGLTSGTNIGLNLGEVLRGDRISVSDYELIMGEDQDMRYLCSVQVDRRGIQRAKELVRQVYFAEWIIDNLPGATSFVTTDGNSKYYSPGFKIGYEDLDPVTGTSRQFINNHVTLVIRHRRAPGRAGSKGRKVIVGFEVYPRSIEAENRNETTGFPEDLYNVEKGMLLDLSSNTTYTGEGDPDMITIPYTYSVYFREEEHIEWNKRWDMYLVDHDDGSSSKAHWFAIINSLVISGLLTTVVAVIFARTIRGEIALGAFKDEEGGKLSIKNLVKVPLSGLRSPRKSLDKSPLSSGLLEKIDHDADDLTSDDELAEDLSGWKLVHTDVFRPPQHGIWLAPLVGSGSQLAFMVGGLLLLSTLGILNPSFRGGYISLGIALFVFAGLFSGYFSARIYRTFGGRDWKRNVFVTATMIPGLLFGTVFGLNMFTWARASSTAIPFGTLVALLILWLGIQLPLVYVGAWYGFIRVGEYNHPVRPAVIPRQIPRQPWYSGGLQGAILAGGIPFAVLSVELNFVFRALWLEQTSFYYVYGFLSVVSLIAIATVVETSIIATYLLLCRENYKWWWHAFVTGGSSALWMFGYCAWCFYTTLHIEGFVSTLLFFTYSGMACLVYGLLTGTIGFLASYAFVRRIYRYASH